jgi:hypothetical protein
MDDAYDGPVDLGTPTEDFEAGAKKPKILGESLTINGTTVTYGELFGDDEYDAKRFKSKVNLLMKTPNKGAEDEPDNA